MKLKKWERDICKAYVNMYKAKGEEIDLRWLEWELSGVINNINMDHRSAVKEYLLTL